jgi:energy-coupling factor transport system ATP-binding protein
VLVEHRVAEWLPLIDRVVVLSPSGAVGGGGGVVADGPPATVFADAAALTEAGVWLPDHRIPPRRADGAPGDVLLTGHGLGFTHPGATRPALSNVDVEVSANRVLAVTGASGAGKSTLALLLGGLVAPTHGLVRPGQALARPVSEVAHGGVFWNRPTGRDAPGPPHRWRAAALASRIGSVFQNPEHQFLRTRVFDELALGPRRAGRSPRATRSIVDNLLVRLRLDTLALANPYTLSGGEQRRLSVATALATAPQVLILDEPTFGQDRRTWTELIDLLADLRAEGRAIVTVTHDTQFVETLADAALPLSTPQPLPVT